MNINTEVLPTQRSVGYQHNVVNWGKSLPVFVNGSFSRNFHDDEIRLCVLWSITYQYNIGNRNSMVVMIFRVNLLLNPVLICPFFAMSLCYGMPIIIQTRKCHWYNVHSVLKQLLWLSQSCCWQLAGLACIMVMTWSGFFSHMNKIKLKFIKNYKCSNMEAGTWM